MVNLEEKSIEIQNHTHDGVIHDFDRVSDHNDNGSTPLQGQQDEQPEAVNSAENAIEHNAVDILTGYTPWSTDTNDICDNNEVIYNRNRQEIQDKLYKDTPVKTGDNKPYIDNIDAYNRDRAPITLSLSDRLGLGQNSLPGAQQVSVAMMHTDNMTDIPEYLRQISLGQKTESTSYEETDRNRNIIPQIDGTMDSRDSLDQTLDSIDLTKSSIKNTNTQRDIEKINEDTSDDDIDEIEKIPMTTGKRAKIVKSKKGRTTKVYATNIERKRLLKQRREKVLQNAKDRKLVKVNAPVTLKASIRANTASKDTQDITMADNATTVTDNTDNAAIDAENIDDAATSDHNTDNATTDGENTDDAATSNNNIDNAAIDRDNTDDATRGHDNTDNAVIGKASTVHIPWPPYYGGKAKDPSQIKTSSKHNNTTAIAKPSIDDPILDGHDTVRASSHTIDLSNVCIYEFLIQGAPNPCDFAGIEEDQLLEIQ